MAIINIHKKSQAEIMGILVVIILISLGMLLVARFVVTKKPSTAKQTFSRDQAATNALTAMLKSTTDCNKLTITELYRNCANNLPDGTVSCTMLGNTLKSCEYVNNTISEILKITFNQSNLNMQYYYTVNKSSDDLYYAELKSRDYEKYCTGKIISKPNYLPLTPGYLVIELSVC